MVKSPLTAELLRRLRSDGISVEHDEARSVLLLRQWEELELDPPVAVEVTERELSEAVNVGSALRDELWPDQSVTSAGLNLLLVHLEELIRTGRAETGPLRITGTGIRAEHSGTEGPEPGGALGPDPLRLRGSLSGDTYKP